MATTFHTLDKDLYGQDGFLEDYKQAQWANMSSKQSNKILHILSQDNQNKVQDDTSVLQELGPDEVRVAGELFDDTNWDELPLSQKQKDVIGHLISSAILVEKTAKDIVVGRYTTSASTAIGLEKRVGPQVDVENYSFINGENADLFQKHSTDNVYLLMLRVKPTGGQTATVDTHIVELPANSPNIQSLNTVFATDINAQEFAKQIHYCQETLPVS